MASCPKCLSNIDIPEQFFGGLFTCPKCQAVYFLSFDGTPEKSEPIEPFQPPIEAVPLEPVSPIEGQDLSAFEPGESIQSEPSNPEPLPPFETSMEPQELPNYDQPLVQSPVTSLNDVIRYANSDSTPSPMSFKVCIQGLDLLQNINELKELLSDSKLQIKFEDLRKSIQNGQLIIDKLQPAKAAVLAQRLRALDLKMIWEQKLYD